MSSSTHYERGRASTGAISGAQRVNALQKRGFCGHFLETVPQFLNRVHKFDFVGGIFPTRPPVRLSATQDKNSTTRPSTVLEPPEWPRHFPVTRGAADVLTTRSGSLLQRSVRSANEDGCSCYRTMLYAR